MKINFGIILVLFLIILLGSVYGIKKFIQHKNVAGSIQALENKNDQPALPEIKNIVIVVFDGLQAKHLHEYGYPKETTPNLDSILNKSTIFINAISPAPWTVPAHASIFTSMFPSEHKVVNKFVEYDKAANKMVGANLQKLSPSAITLAQALKDYGFQTAAFTGDAGVSASFGFDAGFETFEQTKEAFKGFEVTVPKALDWVRSHKENKFFLFLHGYDVHGQSVPAGGFDFRYVKQPYNGKYTGNPKEQGILREEGLKNSKLTMKDEDLDFWKAIYDEKINRVDGQFGGFMRQMEQMGLMENTVFILISDHGTEFMEHNKFDHGHSLYGELEDVLFSIYVPGVRGKQVREQVTTLDIFPTIFGLLGKDFSSYKQIKGDDISKAVTSNGTVPQKNIFFETDYRLYTHKRGVQTPDGWKMIMTMTDSDVEKELYDLNTDPIEKTNLMDIEPKIAYELEQVIYAHLKEMDSNGPWPLGCLPVYGDQCQ
jgi:choline-sulfatase